MNDYRIKLQVKNNRLLERREKLNLSQPDFARFADVSLHVLRQLEAMRTSPLTTRGEWKPCAKGIADFLGVELAELWPEHMQRAIEPIEVKTNVTPIALPPDPVEVKQLGAAIGTALSSLTPREEQIVRMRYGLGDFEREHSLEEIAERFEVSRERARQVCERAMGKLRHRSRSTRLRLAAG